MSQTLKYPKEEYENSGFYDGDTDCEFTQQIEKLVKCRKSHTCASCQSEIPASHYALKESALFPSEGWRTCYTCTQCIEKWLDELHELSVD